MSNIRYLPSRVPFGLALADLESTLARDGLSASTRLNYRNAVGRALTAMCADDPEAWRERMADRDALARYVVSLTASNLVTFTVAWRRWRDEWPAAATWGDAADAPVAVTASEPVPEAVALLWRTLATRLSARNIATLTVRDVAMHGYPATLDDPTPLHLVTVRGKNGEPTLRACKVPRPLIAPVVRRALRDGETWPAPDRPLTGRYPGAEEPYPISVVRAYITGIERIGA